tara:strand:- start:597 stop:1826 length:1230 start_codon:yes stop_codon:yes gene_type:complete
MRILLCHNNFPAQFRRLAPFLEHNGHEVVFLHKNIEWHAQRLNNVRLLSYKVHRETSVEFLHPYIRRFESSVIEGQGAYRACQSLINEGWFPDVVVSHAGFGNGLYLADAFPDARRIVLAEWFYNAKGSDVDFLNHGCVDNNKQLRLRTWNAQTLLEIAGCDQIVSPTHWQRSQFPSEIRKNISVIHEGIDVSTLRAIKNSSSSRSRFLGQINDPNAELITYVSRGFEEYRGFPQAMHTFARLQAIRPHVHVLIAGSDVVAYGNNRSDGKSWKEWALADVGLDPGRTHWLGALQENAYHHLLASSDVHFYLTVPFVLSWSLLEAMAAGCSIVSSATQPVLEVLRSDHSALLVDFFDVPSQVAAVNRLLEDRVLAKRLASAAQKASSPYDVAIGLEAWSNLLSVDTDQTA